MTVPAIELQFLLLVGKIDAKLLGAPSEKNTMTRRLDGWVITLFNWSSAFQYASEELVLPAKLNLLMLLVIAARSNPRALPLNCSSTTVP